MKIEALPDLKSLDKIIKSALAEDIGSGDVTTNALMGAHEKAVAVWVAKQSGTIAGLHVAERVFQHLDKDIVWTPYVKDGDTVLKGDVFVEMTGKCKAVLTGERTALNFTQRMSGIATKTAEMVKILAGYPVKILDTRKTVPGLRLLDKYAVKAGGGSNHRMGLFDLAMIKENHIRAAGSISEAVNRVRRYKPGINIEVETTSLEEVDEALLAGADIIMLDNMDVETMRRAVDKINKRAKTEASGNITPQQLKSVVETGVDYISAGILTHSVEAFDISQQLKKYFNKKVLIQDTDHS